MILLIMNIGEETKITRNKMTVPRSSSWQASALGPETQGPPPSPHPTPPPVSPAFLRVPLRSGVFVVLCVLGRTGTLRRFLNVNEALSFPEPPLSSKGSIRVSCCPEGSAAFVLLCGGCFWARGSFPWAMSQLGRCCSIFNPSSPPSLWFLIFGAFLFSSSSSLTLFPTPWALEGTSVSHLPE